MNIYFLILLALVDSRSEDDIGYIAPDPLLPIELSANNAQESVTYTFKLSFSAATEAGMTLTVSFPSQYILGLGATGTPVCSVTCVISNRDLSFTLASVYSAGETVTLTAEALTNPTSAGGTGPFSVSLYKGSYLKQTNRVFAVIGIMEAADSLFSAYVDIAENSSYEVLAVTNYEFVFTLKNSVTAGNWIKFVFPSDGFGFDSSANCSSIKNNGIQIQGDLKCATDGNTIKMTGISQDIPDLVEIKVHIQATNPPGALTTGDFAIYTGTGDTNSIIDKLTDIAGVDIIPNQISSITLVAQDSLLVTRLKSMLYVLTFTTTNDIPQGGYIEIKFNSYFNPDVYNIAYVVSGLEDISESLPITFTYSASEKTMRISNFLAFTAGTISLVLELTNPQISGNSEVFIISTYNTSSLQIDSGSTPSVSILSESSCNLSVSPSSAVGLDSGVTYEFTIIPQVEVPILGYIAVKFPSEFTLGSPSTATCQLTPKDIGTDSSTSCQLSSSTYTVQLFSSTTNSPAGSGAFPMGHDSKVTFSSLVTNPAFSTYYKFDVVTYDQNNSMLESCSTNLLVTPDAFTAVSVSTVLRNLDQPTVFIIDFTTTQVVPASTDFRVNYGFIEVEFPTSDGTNDLFKTDLGLGIVEGGTVPCLIESGATGTLACVLYTKPTAAGSTANAVVRAYGFEEISAGQQVKIHLAGIHYVQTTNAPTVTVSTKTRSFIRDYSINSGSVLLGVGDNSSPTTSTDNTNTIAFDQTVIKSTATLTVTGLVTTVSSSASTPYLALQLSQMHSEGYCTLTLTCSLGGSTLNCWCYSNLFLIELTGALSSGTQSTLVLNNLLLPSSVPSPVDVTEFWVISSELLNERVETANFPVVTANGFKYKVVSASNTNLRSVAVTYTFELAANDEVPSGGSIKIIFPDAFALSTSMPDPACETVALSGSIVCAVSGNSMLISGLNTLIAETIFEVRVKGVKNPNSGATTGTFTVQTFTENSLLIDQDTVSAIALTGTFVSSLIDVSGLSAYPDLPNERAEYEINISLFNLIPANGFIVVLFPSEYTGLPESPECRISGGVSALASCTNNGNSVLFELGEAMTSNTATLWVRDVINPSGGQTGDFYIYSMYDNSELDVEQEAGSSDNMSISTSFGSLTSSVDVYPQNEGEKSLYEVVIVPSSDITEPISVVFPTQFDPALGTSISCSGSVTLSCTKDHEREITVTLANTLTAQSTLTINIYGVFNPSEGTTDNFKIGIGSWPSLSQYTSTGGAVDIISAPNLMFLNSITTSNTKARNSNAFGFELTLTQKSIVGGSIRSIFPDEYVVEDSISCSSSSFWVDGTPDCSSPQSNLIEIESDDEEYSGDLSLSLSGVSNPLFEGQAPEIILSFYDQDSANIVERTYSNVNLHALTYTYPGPVIKVNNEESITVYPGTYTTDISISLDYPVALSLTLTPSSDTLLFNPLSISLSLGDTGGTIAIGASSSIAEGTYSVEWDIDGDLAEPFYTRILKSTIIVSKSNAPSLSISGLTPIPVGGKSNPITLTLDAAPTDLLTINLSVSSLTVFPNTLIFYPGDSSLTFQIEIPSETTITTSQLSVELVGSNPYLQNSYTYTVTIASTLPEAPKVNSLSIHTVSKTSVTFTITTNEICRAYYATALLDTQMPSFEDVKNQVTPPYTTTLTQYGVVNVGTGKLETFTVTNLRPGLNWAIWIYAENLLEVNSTDLYMGSYFTSDLYRSVDFSLNFTDSYLTDTERDNIESALHLVLSLKSSRLISKTDSTSSNQVEYYVADDSDTENYPTPKNIVSRLNSYTSKMTELLPSIVTENYQGTEISLVPCGFKGEVQYFSHDYQTTYIETTLVSDGYLYAVAVLASNDPGNITPQQISLGVDGYNRQAAAFTAFKLSAGVLTNATLVGTAGSATYRVYTVCGNDYPGKSQLQSSENVKNTTITTLAQPKVTIDLSYSWVYTLGGVIFLILS